MFRVLFIGDIFGEPGRSAVKQWLPRLQKDFSFNFVVANCENAAHGRGINPRLADQLLACGVDVLTSGNHIWHSEDIYDYLKKPECRLLRPANFAPEAPGRGFIVVAKNGIRIAVINLIGRLFMPQQADNPLKTADLILDQLKDKADLFLVDMHGEATSEKRVIGHYLDSRVQACVGSHTHVQTADEEILPGGLAYISDLGMTGPYNSVIGLKKEVAIKRFLTGLPEKFEVAEGDVRFCGAVIDIDAEARKAVSIKRVCEKMSA